jgi:hypothetical protein
MELKPMRNKCRADHIPYAILDHSSTEIASSNPARGVDIGPCPRLFCVVLSSVGKGPAVVPSAVKEVILNFRFKSGLEQVMGNNA